MSSRRALRLLRLTERPSTTLALVLHGEAAPEIARYLSKSQGSPLCQSRGKRYRKHHGAYSAVKIQSNDPALGKPSAAVSEAGRSLSIGNLRASKRGSDVRLE